MRNTHESTKTGQSFGLKIVFKSMPFALLCVLSSCRPASDGNSFPRLSVQLNSINISKASRGGALGLGEVPVDIGLRNISSKPLTVSLVALGGVIRSAWLQDEENQDRWEFPELKHGQTISFDFTRTVTLFPNAKTNCTVYVITQEKPIALVNSRLIEKADLKVVPHHLLYIVPGIVLGGSGLEKIYIDGGGETSVN